MLAICYAGIGYDGMGFINESVAKRIDFSSILKIQYSALFV